MPLFKLFEGAVCHTSCLQDLYLHYRHRKRSVKHPIFPSEKPEEKRCGGNSLSPFGAKTLWMDTTWQTYRLKSDSGESESGWVCSFSIKYIFSLVYSSPMNLTKYVRFPLDIFWFPHGFPAVFFHLFLFNFVFRDEQFSWKFQESAVR